ncbi:MAG: dihydroorotate dehydrogenase (quinone) [bacterium]|nr:dihydroorotate dehydrogenase (quinone) [bacterium]
MYQEYISPWLDRRDSETWHNRAKDIMHAAETTPMTRFALELVGNGGRRFTDPRLQVESAGIKFDNPLVVAAGWTPDGKACHALYLLGFAGVTVGSVPEFGQPGNPKPRQFMIGHGVALNRKGFANPGMKAVRRMMKRYEGSRIPIGISIGKNKEVSDRDAPAAYARVATYLAPLARWLVINVSSPNTPGLRNLQGKELLTDIMWNVQGTVRQSMSRSIPIFIKIDPDMPLAAVDDVMMVAVETGAAGIIAANTTVDERIKRKYGERWASEPGGVSGSDPDYRDKVDEKITHIYRSVGNELDVWGVGGIDSTASAIRKIKRGARIVKIHTGIRTLGPRVASMINRGIADYLTREGIARVTDLIGTDLAA